MYSKYRTIVTKTIFPGITNHYNTMFWGEALKMMDEDAFITATRLTRSPVVTVATEAIQFKESIPAGSIIEVVGNIINVGDSSIRVRTDIYVEDMYKEGKKKVVSGEFVFVDISKNKTS